MSKKKKVPGPECLAIIICESVVEDARSHNKSLLNIFNTIHSLTYPAQHDRLTVFASLTSGRGTAEFEMRMIDDETQKPMISATGQVDFPNPLAVVDITIDMRHVPIPKAGYYSIQLFVGGALLSQRRISAQVMKGGSKG